MFKGLKKLFSGADSAEKLLSPLNGKLVPMKDVPDPTFAEEMLGPGVAIIPSEGKLFAPADGSVTLVFDTLHAVAIKTTSGAELLFHLGLDTVKENGAGVEAHVSVGDEVKAGDVMISFDKEALEAKGYNLITPMILTNKAEFSSIDVATEKLNQNVSHADVVLTLTKA